MQILQTTGLSTLVDDDIYELAIKHSWIHNRTTGYIWTKINGECVYLHQFVMGKAINGYVIDHINENKLDNQKSNLQIILRGENLKKKIGNWGNNTSGYRGVAPYKNGKWQAYYNLNGKRLHISNKYKTAEAAFLGRELFIKDNNL